MITEGSLCTGYDGLGTALRARHPDLVTRWQAENDDDMARVLAHHHPGVLNVRDVTATLWDLAPAVDILSAGFPCQPVSAAGRQRGDADDRWLWPYVLDVVRAVRPGAVFLENVQNIVSIEKGRLLAGILDDLRSAGYRSRWTVLGACAVGAPHHRHRWFLVAGHVGPSAPPPERIGRIATCGAPRSGGRVLLPSPTTSDANGPGRASKTGGDDLRTTIAELLPTPTTSNAHGNDVNARGELLLPGAVQPERWGRFAEAVALWERVTGTPAPEPTEPNSKGDGRRLSPLLPEWMMGLPPGHLTSLLPRSAAIRAAGNGVVPLQAAAAWDMLTATP